MNTKEKVLEFLQAAGNEYISGSQIASHLNISRSAVWKAIKQIRADGYQIDAVTHKGYRIVSVEDKLSRNIIHHHLINLGVPREKLLPVFVYGKIDSTVTAAKKHIEKGAPNGSSIIADCLTAAKLGPLDVSFFPPGNLYMSVIFHHFSDNALKAYNTIQIGVKIVVEVLHDIYGVNCTIIDADNIFYNGKKVGGLISEGFGQIKGGIKTIISSVLGLRVDFDALGVKSDRPFLAANILKRLVYDAPSTDEAD